MRGGKIISVITIIAIIVVGFLFLTKKYNFNIKDVIQFNKDTVDLEQLSEDYQKSLRALMPVYETITAQAQTGSATMETIDSLKNKMLELKMPAEFKDAHIDLVMLLERVEDGVDKEEGTGFDYQKMLADSKIINKHPMPIVK